MASPGSCHKDAMDFNKKHGKKISHDIATKLTEKFKKTESVTDQPRSGCPHTSTDEGATGVVLDAFARSPQKKAQKGCLQKAVSAD
jgi:hypothetical protein